jgi:hypothetical protein
MAKKSVLGRPRADLTGQRFGRLFAVRYIQESSKYECACDCGNLHLATGSSLRRGSVTSCGCLRREMVASKNTKHGLSHLPEYEVWLKMRDRCTNERATDASHYLGRGISVCERWMNSFEAFFEDMGPRPTARHTIERKNNDLGYCKENCCWATRKEQARNTRQTIQITINGVTKTAVEWAEINGLKPSTVYQRIRNGWDAVAAATIPATQKNKGRFKK